VGDKCEELLNYTPRTWNGAQGPSKKSSNDHEDGGVAREGHFTYVSNDQTWKLKGPLVTCVSGGSEGANRVLGIRVLGGYGVSSAELSPLKGQRNSRWTVGHL
jgi:hypothetical protein